MKYGKIKITAGRLQSVEIYEGETIEQKVNRIVNNNEPITDGAPIIFTDRYDWRYHHHQIQQPLHHHVAQWSSDQRQ